MKAWSTSRNHGLRLGKSLREQFPGIALTTCQEWAAQILGYRDLHELSATDKRGSAGGEGQYDEDISQDEVERRRAFQAEKLSGLARIPMLDAQRVIKVLAPTARRKPAAPEYMRGSVLFNEVGEFAADGDVNDGLRKALAALQTGRKASPTGKMFVLLVIQRALDGEPHDPSLLRQVKERGSDLGWQECSYSLACDLASTWGDPHRDAGCRPPIAEVKRVDKLYSHVIAASVEDEDLDLRSAAMVNRARIVRDGLLTGERDWPGAVRLYEDAAQMGNVVGAYNAARVSEWLARQGQLEYARRSLKWYRLVLESVQAGTYQEQHCGHAAARSMAEKAHSALAHLVMDDLLSADGDAELQQITAAHEADCKKGGHGRPHTCQAMSTPK